MMDIAYRVIRSSRRTIAVQISPEGEVTVRCPRRMGDAAVHAFVKEKEGWILAHLEKIRCRPRQPCLTEEELKALSRKAAQVLPERVRFFAPRVGTDFGRITIRCQHTRWGSCSGRGNLNFNCLLMLAPSEVVDYVVVHELCHRKEMNHSCAFWSQVERVMPEYRIHKKWLKDNGPALMARLKKPGS